LGAAFGAGGAAGAGGVWAWAWESIIPAVKAVAAHRVKTRPRGNAGAAKIRKVIAENPF
jgi:hypothetical protein